MKKIGIILGILVAVVATGCKKNVDTFAFEGTVVDYVNCTSMAASISEVDFGYVVALTTPDSVGESYTSTNGNSYKNCVVLYRTRTRLKDGESIKGTMYLDDNYSRAYCNYHYDFDIPEGVCYTIE